MFLLEGAESEPTPLSASTAIHAVVVKFIGWAFNEQLVINATSTALSHKIRGPHEYHHTSATGSLNSSRSI